MDLESHGEAHRYLNDDIISGAVLRSHQSEIPKGLSEKDDMEITRTGQPHGRHRSAGPAKVNAYRFGAPCFVQYTEDNCRCNEAWVST